MELTENAGSIIITGLTDFEPAHIFECGQCFRWDQEPDGSYTGIAKNRAVNIEKRNGNIIINNTSLGEFNEIWQDYFDLDFDYSALKQQLSTDEVLSRAIKSGEGIRILNQDLWECIISFIISANNNIPRIKGIIKNLCAQFGQRMNIDGKIMYTFPDVSELKGVKVEELEPLKCGYRDKYIVDAVAKVNSGEVDLKIVANGLYDEAKRELLKIKGIGSKVADCILLFGAGKRNAFPVDIWIKRVMETLYEKELGKRDISEFAKERFGNYGGFAQQYLFYYMRESVGRLKK